MRSEREERLQELQKVKEKIYSDKLKAVGIKDSSVEQNALKKIKEIENEMAELNKLDDREKNIHAIWLKAPSQNEIDNLKLWARYNPKYTLHLWTDSTHILLDKLNEIIIENARNSSAPYETEANLKDKFYYNYHLKNLNQTFDENAMLFLITNKYATETQVLNWIKEEKEKNSQIQAEISKYAINGIVFHDINNEKDKIFFSKRYEKGYLRDLEKLHISETAVNKLSYTILDKFGGVYFDTSVMPKFNLKELKADKKIRKLVDEIKWNEYDNQDILEKKTDIILNQIITFKKLKQLNDEKLTDFVKNWEEKFSDNFNDNLKIFKEIAKKIKSKNFTSKPKKNLSDFPISNVLQLGVEFYKPNTAVNNAFLISKANSKFLQKVMDGIEAVDENTKTWDIREKLTNQKNMIAFHTGPENLINRIQENDRCYYFDVNVSKIIYDKNVFRKLDKFQDTPSKFATVDNIDFYKNKDSFYKKGDKFEDINHIALQNPDPKYYIQHAKDNFWFNKKEVLSYKQQKDQEEKFRKQLRGQDASRKGKQVRWEDELQIPKENLQGETSARTKQVRKEDRTVTQQETLQERPNTSSHKIEQQPAKQIKPLKWKDWVRIEKEKLKEERAIKARELWEEDRAVIQQKTLQAKHGSSGVKFKRPDYSSIKNKQDFVSDKESDYHYISAEEVDNKNKRIIKWIKEVEAATKQKAQKESTKEIDQEFEFEI